MVNKKKTIPFVPILAIGAALLFVSYHLVHVLTPFALSLALAYVVNPVVTHFEARGLRRDPVVLLFYMIIGVVLMITTTQVLPIVSDEWTQLQSQAPVYVASTQKFLDTLPARIAQHVPLAAKQTKQVEKQIEQWTKSLYAPMLGQVQRLPEYLLGLFPLLSLFFLVPFITFFLLLDAKHSINGMIQACPSRYVEQVLYLISEIDSSLGNYLRGILIEAAAVTFAAFVGLLALDINHAFAIAVLTGLSSFVPYLGAAIGAAVGGLAALIQFGTMGPVFQVLLLFMGIRFADDWLLQPIISKHSVHLHPLVFLLSLMAGGEILGFLGLVFAIPVACIIKSLFKVAWDWYTTETLRDEFDHIDTGIAPYT